MVSNSSSHRLGSILELIHMYRVKTLHFGFEGIHDDELADYLTEQADENYLLEHLLISEHSNIQYITVVTKEFNPILEV